MITYLWWGFLLAALPFVLVIVVEVWLNKVRKELPPQFIVFLGRLSGIVYFLAIFRLMYESGWLNHAVLKSFISLNPSSILATLLLGLIAWAATSGIRRFGQANRRDMKYLPMTLGHLIFFTGVGVVYLFLYEWFIRGFLLPADMQPNFLVALCNILFYGIIHLPRGWRETVGALVFGLVVTPVTLLAGSIWPGFLAHLIISLHLDMMPTYQHNKAK